MVQGPPRYRRPNALTDDQKPCYSYRLRSHGSGNSTAVSLRINIEYCTLEGQLLSIVFRKLVESLDVENEPLENPTHRVEG